MKHILPLVIILAGFPTLAQAQKAPEAPTYPIAGINPSQRPAGAPTITEVKHGKEWESRFFYGISKPYPPHLGTPANWGNWFVPFDRPGMTGKYDIRGWHVQKKSPAKRKGGKKS